jgi:hypothetical protein
LQIVVDPCGVVRCLYCEDLDLAAFGPLRISRASHLDPTGEGRWMADLAPAGGPLLGPFQRRSEALAAEVAWLEQHWLG